MIAVKNASKRLGVTQALDRLDMNVPDGSVYGLVGPNGAGKTTVIRHLCGALRPDSGQVLVAGQQVFENPQVKAQIATIQSQMYCYRKATVDDFQRLYVAMYPGFDSRRFKELGHTFDIRPDARITELSKGKRKQAAFWLALSARPRLLLLDEPADGLDPLVRHTVRSLVMDDVAANGTTVLMSSHDLRDLTDVCDWIGIMVHGRMRVEAQLDDLQRDYVKVQVAFPDDRLMVPDGLEVLAQDRQGRLFTLAVHGSSDRVQQAFAAVHPSFFNLVPLTLEEIFIYAAGGDSDDERSDRQ